MFKQKGVTSRTCSFCGKEQEPGRRLIRGPGVAICSECVVLCTEIPRQEGVETPPAERCEPGHDLEHVPSDALLEGLRRRSSGIHRAQQQLQEAVMILRQRGTTWARIGEALGVSRQSAWERYSGEE